MLVRFSFTYDNEFDADIHEMLQNTPTKRRSERLRQYIRLGMKESQQASQERRSGDSGNNRMEYQKPEESGGGEQTRKAIRFGPSNSTNE